MPRSPALAPSLSLPVISHERYITSDVRNMHIYKARDVMMYMYVCYDDELLVFWEHPSSSFGCDGPIGVKLDNLFCQTCV